MTETPKREGTRGRDNPKSRRILTAARNIFCNCGYSTASMDAIADKAGVSKATVYAHFDSKEQLFEAMVNQECQHFLARMEIPTDVEQLALRPALMRIATNYLELILTPRALSMSRMVTAESRRFPELGVIFYESGPKVMREGLTQYLETARERGIIETDNTRLAAYQFIGMLRGDLHLRAMLGIEKLPRKSVDLVAQRAVDTFLIAYGGRKAG